MVVRTWGWSALLGGVLVASAALPATAPPQPASPAARPDPAAQVTQAPAAVVVITPTMTPLPGGTNAATPLIRSVVPGGAPGVRPCTALLAPGSDAAPAAALRSTREPPSAGVVHPPLAPVAPAPAAARPGMMPVGWDGELRVRIETRSLLDYRLPGTFGRSLSMDLPDRGDFSLVRTRIGARLRLATGVSGYVSAQGARSTGDVGTSSGTIAGAALHRAWLDLDSLGVPSLHLRIGRQALGYGEGRVLASPDWDAAQSALDGARLRWAPGHAQLDGFVTVVDAGRAAGAKRVLSGLDALWRGPAGLEAEAYHFRRAFGDAGGTGEPGGIHDATSGMRAFAREGPFELRVEGAVQGGRRAGEPVSAGFAVARVTADLGSAWQTRLFAEHALSSGDEDPNDRTFQRFEPVRWDGHAWQGALDIAGAANSSDWCGGLAARPQRGWEVASEFHLLSLAQPRDAWVADDGTPLRSDPTGSSGTVVGREWDATVRWDTCARASVLIGGSWFWRGVFVRDTGGGGDFDWGFLQLNVRL